MNKPSEAERIRDRMIRTVIPAFEGEGSSHLRSKTAHMSDTAPLPIFETERLILRGVTEKDIPAWRQHLADYEIASNLVRDGFFFHPEAIFPERQGKSQWVWGIFLKSQPDKLIGIVCLLLHNQCQREGTPANRGFWLAKDHWGKGIITEAIFPVMEYAFNNLNFDRMILANALGNMQLRRIKEKDGAVFLRTEPAYSPYVNPDYKERELWELTKERWETFHAAQ
jgi:ribosomal-protein-alanine N-acetyltransferase